MLLAVIILSSYFGESLHPAAFTDVTMEERKGDEGEGIVQLLKHENRDLLRSSKLACVGICVFFIFIYFFIIRVFTSLATFIAKRQRQTIMILPVVCSVCGVCLLPKYLMNHKINFNVTHKLIIRCTSETDYLFELTFSKKGQHIRLTITTQ